MKDSELNIDLTCHVLYSKPCKAQIQSKIALHYPEGEQEAIWTRVQKQYAAFLSDWRTDLGGAKNFHNGAGGNYDCVALMAYYVVCKDVTSVEEIEQMEGDLFLPVFRKMKFVDCNRPIFKRLMHRAFLNAKKQCDKWGDFKMNVAPFDKGKPIYYEFTECPTAEFAKKHGLLEGMPELADDSEIEIRPEEIEMQACRSSGAGGQHINKTSSAVRLTHLPTGIVVFCQTERSQFQNRDNAMKMLRAKLAELKLQQHAEKISDLKGVQMKIEWGSQIRSYVFMPYTLAKDTRTGYEMGNIQAVMDGDIDGFINAYLTAAANGEIKK